MKRLLGKDGAWVKAGGRFEFARGPVSPDHIVYAKSYPLAGEPTEESVRGYREKHGYSPRVVCCEAGVAGVGEKEKEAELALELTRDAALVVQLTETFGGIRYMPEREAKFIENWEAEAYRRKLIG